MLVVFHIFQTVGYYGFANWVPTLLVRQGITITNSLLYTTIIALAAPIGPLIGFFVADKFERKTVIVAMAGFNIVCGLIFSQVTAGLWVILMGLGLTLAGNIISYNFHLYQQELFHREFGRWLQVSFIRGAGCPRSSTPSSSRFSCSASE